MAPIIILMYALMASSFSIGKVLLSYVPPLFLTGIRMVIAGGIMLTYHYFLTHHTFKIKKKYFLTYAQVIILGMFLAYYLRFWGLEYVSSSKAAFLFSASPFFAAIYSYFIFNERLSTKQWLSMIIGFIGLIPVLLTSSAAEHQLGEFFFMSTPELAILISVALYSYSWVLIRSLIHDTRQPTMLITSVCMLCGGLLALIGSLMVETIPNLGPNLSTFAGWLAINIVISNMICYSLYGYLLKHFSATFISFAGFLSPIFAALYGWAFLNEQITWHFFAAMGIVLIGLFLFYQEELDRKSIYQ